MGPKKVIGAALFFLPDSIMVFILLCIVIGKTHRQSSLFYVAFDRQASLIKDDLLEPIDALLDDEELVDLVRQALGARSPKARVTGRRGIAPDRLLRCCVLKHIKGWSLRQLEREVRSNLVYRRFTRFDQDTIPNFSTFSRCLAAVGDDLTRQIHKRVVALAQQERVAPGRKMRTDTTVVETNIHHPTDSSLLADGIRVLTRSLDRIAKHCAPGTVKFVDHARAAKHRVLEINRAAKSFTEQSRQRLKDGYGKLLGLARNVMHKAEKVVEDLQQGRAPVVGSVLSVVLQQGQIENVLPLVKNVIAQTKARVFGGNTHVSGKVISLFEPHTQAIPKGKAHKPTEFGRLIRIDEVENGIVSNYDIKEGNPADQKDFVPALSQHKEIFGRVPDLATADRGFHSAANVRQATELGVKKVALPSRGKPSQAQAKIHKQRWFQRALRWRAGIEGRIATLKHRFQMVRARYKGDAGLKRHVGWSVIANNLVSIARTCAKRQRKAITNASQANHAA